MEGYDCILTLTGVLFNILTFGLIGTAIDGETEGEAEGLRETETLGEIDKLIDGLGLSLGETLGLFEGLTEGERLCDTEGLTDGLILGEMEALGL